MNASIVDVLIENIKTDQGLLQEVEAKIETAKDEKQEIVNRQKEQQKDMATLLKYADETQQAKITELGFEFSEPQKNVNTIAAVAFDIIIKAKDNQMTNGDLYDDYIKSCKDKKEDFVNYSAFNIKCRSLFNTQKLLRKKGVDPKSSRADIVSLNGRVMPNKDIPAKQEVNTPIEASKKTSEKPKENPIAVDLKKIQAMSKKGK
jgi:hypothetical protein|tara:strand:+ start:22979 stop:23590 length:612 start_codon:yes stop_codon:yes gene_type:complete